MTYQQHRHRERYQRSWAGGLRQREFSAMGIILMSQTSDGLGQLQLLQIARRWMTVLVMRAPVSNFFPSRCQVVDCSA